MAAPASRTNFTRTRCRWCERRTVQRPFIGRPQIKSLLPAATRKAYEKPAKRLERGTAALWPWPRNPHCVDGRPRGFISQPATASRHVYASALFPHGAPTSEDRFPSLIAAEPKLNRNKAKLSRNDSCSSSTFLWSHGSFAKDISVHKSRWTSQDVAEITSLWWWTVLATFRTIRWYIEHFRPIELTGCLSTNFWTTFLFILGATERGVTYRRFACFV